MKIGIIGTGGVGGYFGAKMAEAGNDVTFIARGAHLEAIKQNGLKVESINGDIYLPNANATDDITSLAEKELIIFAVKVWQIEELISSLKTIVHKGMILLPLENGISAHEILHENFGEKCLVLGGLCRIFSFIGEPGVVKHTGYDPSITFGPLYGNLTETITLVEKVIKESNIRVTVSTDIQAEIWKKFVFISSTSAIGAITRVNMGTYRGNEGARKLLEQSLQEMISVGKAYGVNLSDEMFDKTMAFVDKMPHKATTSLQRDMMDGKPSELDAQVGELVRLGEKLNVPTPVNSVIYYALLPQEQQARKMN